MATTSLRWHEAYRFTGVDSHGRAIAIDADLGAAMGAKPSDLVPLSLAACTAYDVVTILRKQRQELRALEATIDAEQDPEPPYVFRRIAVRFIARGTIDERKARRALDLSSGKYCSVAATLRPTVTLEFAITVEPD